MTTHPQQDVCCLMGDPIAGNPTQYMLEKAFEAARLDWRFLTFDVPALDFEGALRGARIFSFSGIMLAPPHRSRVMPYLENVVEATRISGQVNCIKQEEGKLTGYNTEGTALRQLLEQAGAVKGAKVQLLGAGRLARAIAAELSLNEVREIVFACRDPESAAELTETLLDQTPLEICRVVPLLEDEPLLFEEDCRAIVNATPQKAELPIVIDSLPRDVVVADVGFNPPSTWLMKQAEQYDCLTIDGLTLLIEQAALAFEIWTGVAADRQAMRDAVEEFLVL